MKTRAFAVALLVAGLVSSGGTFAADRPVVKMATVTQEVSAWCLSSGFMYNPAFTAAPPPADFEKVFLSPAQAVVAVENGELALDECVGLGTLAQAWIKGARNAIVIAVAAIEPTYMLIGGKGIKKLDDLKGRALGSNGLQTTATTAVVAILQRGANLQPERDYSFVAVGTAGARLAALAAGKIDGIASYPPYAYKLVDEGYPMLASERQYVPNYVFGTIVVNREWAERNRPLVVAILKTMLQNGRWLKDPAKKNEVIAKMSDGILMGTEKLGSDYARRIYSDVIAVNGGVVEGLYGDRALFTNTLSMLTERGIISKSDPLPIDRMVDYSFLNQARRELRLPPVAL
jgi:ABC-type nitrate/sulfonate/bicarbonate transport system substrate-binding protein